MIQPLPHQPEAITFLASRLRAYLADDMGLGKSLECAWATESIGARKILVVCPAIARIGLAREFTRIRPDLRCDIVDTYAWKCPNSPELVILSNQMVTSKGIRKQLQSRDWDVLIVDEAHCLKTPDAIISRAIFGHHFDLRHGVARKCARVWLMSGTPAPNHPGELWTALHALWPDRIVGDSGSPLRHVDYIKKFCRTRDNGFGTQVVGGKNLDELKAILYGGDDPLMLRRKKRDVLKDLPPIRFATWSLEPTPAMKSQIRKMENQDDFEDTVRLVEILLDGGQIEGDDMALSRHRRLLGEAKIAPAADLLGYELETGLLEKVVVFAHHRAVVHGLYDALGKYGAVAVYGGVSATKRQEAIDTFQKDSECRVFIGQIDSCYSAITLTAASDVVFVEASWVPSVNLQAASRCDRIGQKSSVLVRFLTLVGSLDEIISSTAERKARELSKLFD